MNDFISFEDGEFEASFSADTKRRVIRGLALPRGQVGWSNGQKWRFEPGSLYFSELSRVKLLRDHDSKKAVGKATKFTETSRGIEMEFSVAPGSEGDDVLSLAEHGTLDGLSIRAQFEQISPDPSDRGVNRVHRARLKEVSMCSIPSFDDSRVDAVYSEGVRMQCTRCGQVHPDGVACTAPDPEATFSVSDINKFLEIQAQFARTAEAAKQPIDAKPVTAQLDPNVPSITVVPSETKEAVFVNEKPVYTFDSTSAYSFAADIKAAMKGQDESAEKRVNGWLDAEFAVSTTNAATLNPTINRPDMYVDNLSFEYPIWDTINKGAPPNGVTGFQFPKWNSSTTLTADHTEGTEPSLGGFTVTSQTVTPTALSGKIEINREAWDQMGQPNLDNLIRAEMRRSWFEGLEVAAAAFLDGLSPTEITVTTNAVDSALHQEILGDLIDLLFTRGGYRMRDFLVEKFLYKRLALAKDSDGRLLFPAINPVNAVGTLASFFANLNINGLLGRPAWALTSAAADASDNSYLFAREDVHGWSTAPRFLEFDVQVKSIFLGIWGYKAFANSRTAGIRRFKYDPTT